MTGSTAGVDLYTDARRFAGYHAAEHAMFSTTGRWITEIDEPAVRTRVAAWNQLHAEHVARWEARYPTIAELPPIDGWPADALDDVIAGVIASVGAGVGAPSPAGPSMPPSAPTSTSTTIDARLGVLAELALSPLIDRYRAHRDLVTPALDGPTARCLDVVLADATAELTDCRHLLAR